MLVSLLTIIKTNGIFGLNQLNYNQAIRLITNINNLLIYIPFDIQFEKYKIFNSFSLLKVYNE